MSVILAPYLSAQPALYARPKRARAPKITETAEHKTIADFFALGLGGNAVALHVRNERAGIGARIQAARMGVLAGCPDWVIVDSGRAYFLEIKPRGWKAKKMSGAVKLTLHEIRQLAVHTALRRAHCPVLIVETLDEVIQALRYFGVPLRASASAQARPRGEAPLFDETADAIGSYNDAVRAVGAKVRAGEPVPEFFRSDKPEPAR